MKTLSERFKDCNLSNDNITARIEGFTRSTGPKGTWYTFVAAILTRANTYEEFVCKLNAGISNEDYIKNVDRFFAEFKPGDYNITNVSIRETGATWDDGEGNNGTYKTSYISVPTYSDLLYKGGDAVLNQRTREAQFAKLALQAMVVE
jgi:hypothetical protein